MKLVHKAISAEKDSQAAGLQLGIAIREGLDGAAPDAVVVFASARHDYAKLLSALADATGCEIIVGASSAGEYTSDKSGEGMVSAMGLRAGAHMKFAISHGRGLSSDPAAAAAQLVRGFRGAADSSMAYRSALIMTDALAGHTDTLVEELTLATGGNYRFFGGGAGDDGLFQKTHIFVGREALSDAVVALEILSEKPVGVGVSHGWVPAGAGLRVTEASGMTIISLNGAPAIEAFQDFAQETGQTLDLQSPMPFFLHNVVGIRSGDGYHLRVPLAINADGSVACAAPIPEGAVVHFMKTTEQSAVAAARSATDAALKALGGSKPGAAFVFDCVATRLRLGRAFEDELQACADLLSPSGFVGCNTYGQIARAEGQFGGFTTARLLSACCRNSSVGTVHHTHLTALARLEGRQDAARVLAGLWGCDHLVFFVRDEELGVMIPAPGMAKTFAGGPKWRAFLKSCSCDGRFASPVDLPQAGEREAAAVSFGGTVAILVGGRQAQAALAMLEEQLPFLGALFKAEQKWLFGQSENREARLAADRAQALVKALDAARASAAGLNNQLQLEHARKDEFLAMLAHELRNPLSPLVNSLAILSRFDALDPTIVRHHLDVMARQLNQLTRLVDDLLDVSRVSRGLIELRRERLLLAEVLGTAVESARPAIEVKKHSLKLLHDGALLYVEGDRVRLVQVFANLLQNAAKYTDPGGSITLSVGVDDGQACVVVSDTGVGIQPDMLRRIFDLFEQVQGSLDRSQGGLGIGLTLVRTLTELHGGTVSAYSAGAGGGSKFTVTLPLELASEPIAPQSGSLHAGDSDTRVLVVDDNVDGADSMADVLRLLGVQVEVARDGPGALEAVQSFGPHLVLLDIGLPGMNGYEVARRLRQMPGRNPYLVAVTGYGSMQDRELSRAAGFDKHLVKPVSIQSVEGLLANLGNTKVNSDERS